MFNLFKKKTDEKKQSYARDITVILDNGHGMECKNGSPRWPDGSQLMEWEFTRDIVRRISFMLTKSNIKNVTLVTEKHDISLQERVKRANKIYKDTGKRCFGISVHGNAGGGTGFEVWTPVGKTKSDDIATVIWNEMKSEFPSKKMRVDTSDGDVDKEKNFTILHGTKCPFVLTENFFMDNFDDCKVMMSDAGRQKIANAHVRAIKKILITLY